MNSRIELVTTAHPDQDLMLVEIYFDGKNVAELLEGDPNYVLLLYPRPSGGPWMVPEPLMREAMECAHARLDALLGRPVEDKD